MAGGYKSGVGDFLEMAPVLAAEKTLSNLAHLVVAFHHPISDDL